MGMKKIIILSVIASVLLVAGCKKNPDETKTAEWYKAHDKERGEMLAKCEANPAELKSTANCINASAAQSDLTWESTDMIKTPSPLVIKKSKK